MRLKGVGFSLVGALPAGLAAQTMTIEEYQPKSTLVVPQHPVERAKYPIVDVHSHHRMNPSAAYLEKLIREMDQLNLRVLVNLSGGQGDSLEKGLRLFKAKYADRFAVFANVDFKRIDEPNFGPNAAAQLERDVRNGASGLKIFKNFGMDVHYKDGRRLQVDDPVLDPVFETCARLKIPVLIHTGEPWAFFQPMDKHNERWLELKTHPSRARDRKSVV